MVCPQWLISCSKFRKVRMGVERNIKIEYQITDHEYNSSVLFRRLEFRLNSPVDGNLCYKGDSYEIDQCLIHLHISKHKDGKV